MSKKRKPLKIWQIKLRAIKKIIKSEKFAFLDFERIDKYNGAVEGLFSKGFRAGEIDSMMYYAQCIQSDYINEDVKTDLIVEEAKKILITK